MANVNEAATKMWTDAILQFLDRRIESGADISAVVADLFQSLAAEARSILPSADRSSVRVFEQVGILRFIAVDGQAWPWEMTTTGTAIERQSAGADAIHGMGPVLIEDVQTSKRYRHPLFHDVRSHISVPIFWRGQKAVLSLDSFRNAFSAADVPPLQDLVARTLTVLEHLALIEDRWLLDLQSFLSKAASVDTLCNGALDHIRRLIGVRKCAIFLQYPGSSNLTFVAPAVVFNPSNPVPTYEIGEGLTGYVAETKRPLRLHDRTDVEELRRISEKLAGKQHSKWDEPGDEWGAGRASFLGAPLLVQDALVGVVRLSFKERDEDFSAADEASLVLLASRLALAIQNIWLKEEVESDLKKRIEALEGLRTVGNEFAKTLDIDRLLARVLDAVLHQSSVESGLIRILNERGDRWVLKAARDKTFPMLKEMLRSELANEDDFLGRAAKSPSAIQLPDANDDPEFRDFRERFRGTDHYTYLETVKSFLIVPVRLRERSLGLIILGSKVRRKLPDSTVQFLEILAAEVAVALEVSLLIQERQATEPLAMMGVAMRAYRHELRQPLHLLGAAVSVAEKKRLENKEFFATIKTYIERLRIEVDNFERLTQRDASAREPINLNILVRKAVQSHDFRFTGEVTHEFDLAEMDLVLLGNHVQVELAFRLVIGNALDAMPTSGKLIIKTWCSDGSAYVQFSDNGTGMKEEVLLHIREPFFTTKQEGTGMGLPMVEHIVFLHGGTLNIESESGRGTSVTVSFPQARSV